MGYTLYLTFGDPLVSSYRSTANRDDRAGLGENQWYIARQLPQGRLLSALQAKQG